LNEGPDGVLGVGGIAVPHGVWIAGAPVEDTYAGAEQHAGMSSQEIIDNLSRLKELGVTYSSVPIPPLTDCDAYVDYAQWAMEEIKPKL
jgi:hypothetical protein